MNRQWVNGFNAGKEKAELEAYQNGYRKPLFAHEDLRVELDRIFWVCSHICTSLSQDALDKTNIFFCEDVRISALELLVSQGKQLSIKLSNLIREDQKVKNK